MLRFPAALAFALALIGAVALRAADTQAPASSAKAQLVPVTAATDAAWLANARASYPLTTCSVSGDKLEGGDMAMPADFIYRQDGKPDRLVRFCCKDCVKDFNKDPARYLTAIDAAADKKAAAK